MYKYNNNITNNGVSLGSILAVILSWTTNHSILWCILHFFGSWIYVIYWFLKYSK